LLGEPAGRRLLDVGAGSGAITALAAPDFAEVSVTEASRVMQRKLRARGFTLLRHDFARAPLPGIARFDAVMCLNVLDRCARPRSLLAHLRDVLEPGGCLLVSVPLPLCPHVHVGAATVDPDEPLPASSGSFETDVARISGVLQAHGLAVERLCRAPYLCRGDVRRPLHVLDAVVYLCHATREQPRLPHA
jgi:SAM-dependent methyltransferase